MDSAAKYVARVYKQAVDRQLDVEGVRRYLAGRGILRSPAMVRDDLDNVFCFSGYYATHQPAPAMSAQQWDAQVDH